jgi:transposase-like protein
MVMTTSAQSCPACKGSNVLVLYITTQGYIAYRCLTCGTLFFEKSRER